LNRGWCNEICQSISWVFGLELVDLAFDFPTRAILLALDTRQLAVFVMARCQIDFAVQCGNLIRWKTTISKTDGASEDDWKIRAMQKGTHLSAFRAPGQGWCNVKGTLRTRPLVSPTTSNESRWFACGSFLSASFPIGQLFDALGNSPIGIAICDKRLRFVAVNRKLAEINAIPPDEHPGRFVQEFVGTLASTVEARLQQVFRTKQPLCNAELVGHLGANPCSGHWLENYFPILDAFGRVRQVGVFVIPLLGLRPHSGPDRALAASTTPTGCQPSLSVVAIEQSNESKSHYQWGGGNYQYKTLTPRETDILRLLAEGASSKEASARLAISIKTVDTYKGRLMLKLHATSVAHLVHYAISHHVIGLPE
jgi:DNA-binding CsgD family transcriptional regulator/PAS domain-containing protein